MRLSRGSGIEIKTPSQFARMREAGLVVAQVLSEVAAAAEPGISTGELDVIAERIIRSAGAVPSFLGYHGYPASICTSVNAEIVHGIPSMAVKLAAGDVLSIDAGAIVGGWHGDAARSIIVGGAVPGRDDKVVALLAACELAMWRGIAAVKAGARLTDISHAIETSALRSGPFGVVREYTGHFIGSAMHMDPPVPNYGRPGRGPVLTEGMAMAIEPMLVLGDRHTLLLEDDWTVVTADGSLASHFEHTVAITPDGPIVTTAEDGGQSGLAGLADLDGLAGLAGLGEVSELGGLAGTGGLGGLNGVPAGEDYEMAEDRSGARRP
ncbi:MAG TPA: type I methionyl aminopeptidase [Streptosporangiaceae bacterium]|nr:type I methionyl aminopeptidase [Streptosporangiaceae bacterium]